MDIDMCKSFTAIEMIDRKTENTVASIQGTMYFGKILPHARINIEGYVSRTGEDYPLLRINDLLDDNAMLEFAVIGQQYDVLKLSFLGRKG